jgi:hypothetical protein
MYRYIKHEQQQKKMKTKDSDSNIGNNNNNNNNNKTCETAINQRNSKHSNKFNNTLFQYIFMFIDVINY